MSDNVLKFNKLKVVGGDEPLPGDAPLPEDDTQEIKNIISEIGERADNIETLLCIGLDKDGAIFWRSNVEDSCEILWLVKVMERITMDASLVVFDG